MNHHVKRPGVVIKADGAGYEHLTDRLAASCARRTVVVAAAATWISKESILPGGFYQHDGSMKRI